jgi:LSD1 subclass zinc finger protein
MPVQMLCPNLKCRKILSVPEDARGKLVKCQYCQTMLRVPPAKAEPHIAGGASAKPAK